MVERRPYTSCHLPNKISTTGARQTARPASAEPINHDCIMEGKAIPTTAKSSARLTVNNGPKLDFQPRSKIKPMITSQGQQNKRVTDQEQGMARSRHGKNKGQVLARARQARQESGMVRTRQKKQIPSITHKIRIQLHKIPSNTSQHHQPNYNETKCLLYHIGLFVAVC